MARGQSRASSEKPEGISKSASKKDLVDHFKDLARSDIQPELKGMSKADLNDAADYVLEAVSEAETRQEEHDAAVVESKKLLASSKGTYPFEDFGQIAKVLPLTPDEMDQAEENGEDREEYALNLLQANFEDEVMSDMRGNYEATNTDDYDANQDSDASNRAFFARSLLESRVAEADSVRDAHIDNANTIRQNALERWIDLRESGEV
jgi:hypothetical protein